MGFMQPPQLTLEQSQTAVHNPTHMGLFLREQPARGLGTSLCKVCLP